MEGMLDPITIPFRPSRKAPVQYEPIRENLVQGLNPFTQLLDEENHLTPEVSFAYSLLLILILYC